MPCWPPRSPLSATSLASIAAMLVLAVARGTLVTLIVVGALLLALLCAWGFARWWAWEPAWLVRWRHATAEAGWRASAAWAEFTDWLRLGR